MAMQHKSWRASLAILGMLLGNALQAAPPAAQPYQSYQSYAPRRVAGPLPGPPQPPAVVEEHPVEPIADCHADGCLNDCPDCHQQQCCCNRGCLAAGFAFVMVRPHFENDVAFIDTIDDGNVSTRQTDTSFDYDMELSPRVWLEYCRSNHLGIRATWWSFDHASPQLQATVDEDGEEINSPVRFIRANAVAFEPLDLSARGDGDIFRTQASLDLDAIDLEGTKWTDFCTWQFGTTAGLRYASLQQDYASFVTTSEGQPLNAFVASHRFEGLGPTLSLEMRRPMGCWTWFSMARGSLLFGDGKFGFIAFENLDSTAGPLTTEVTRQRNDVLPVGELQVGLEWSKTYCNGGRFFGRAALEGQLWQGAGTHTEEDGYLGFFGFHAALGMTL